MWPSATSYQSEADEGIDESGGSITASIGVIGRKNLRADAPVFKASNSDPSYSTTYENVVVESNVTSNNDHCYAQETTSEYPQT